jgi:hypothetical protein
MKAQGCIQTLCMVLGKILRSANLRQPIKLNLSALVSKANLDFVLSGLKYNKEVSVLNLSKCGLDNDDLGKICDVLKVD